MDFGSLWFLGSWFRHFFPQLFREEELPSSNSPRKITEKEELVRLLKSKNALSDHQTRKILEKYASQDVKKKQ